MKMSSAQLNKTLLGFLEKRRELIGKLSGCGPLIEGYIYDVMRKCGNPNCHCAAKPGHRQTLMIYSEKGRRRCRLVRRKDEERVKQAWQNTRAFRKAIREIRTLNQRELAILRVQIRNMGLRYK